MAENDSSQVFTDVVFHLYEGSKLRESWISRTPVTVGRQDQGEPETGPFSGAAGQRAIVAPITCRDVPRRYFRVEPDASGRLYVVNSNPHLALQVEGGRALASGDRLSLGNSVTLVLPDKIRLRISATEDQQSDLRSLDRRPMDPAAISMASFYRDDPQVSTDASLDDFAASERLLDMLQHVLPVIRESVTTDSFFRAAAAAAIRIAGLDRALVALLQGDKRTIRAEVFADALSEAAPSSLRDAAPEVSDTMIESVRSTGVTKIYEHGISNSLQGQSLQRLYEAVCAPILDKDRQVIGVLYGDRWTTNLAQHSTDLEAQLVEILAGAIAAGLARQTEERQRSSMELFFSDVVAKHIVADSSLLEPKEENVTMMFCDVRKFSSISKRLGPTKTVEWMQDTFTALSVCVEETGGVVINYVGDELIAMWGAPESVLDHASRALRTAQTIMQWLEESEARWIKELGEPLRLGIGINSGQAAVGNTGSRIKFQYGVFGNVVNIASRLQGATKQFGVECLVAASTASQTGSAFPLRRLATIQVVGIPQEIVVHEMASTPNANWDSLCQGYESALRDYQEMRFADATRKLGELLQEHPDDEPSMRLLGLSVAQLRQPVDGFSGVDVLTEK